MTNDRDRACPGCDSATLAEWDPVLHKFICSTCSTSWRRRPGRMVPANQQPSLPGIKTMSLDSELPDKGGVR
jgi:hypothetical protein